MSAQAPSNASASAIAVWLTTADQSSLLQQQTNPVHFGESIRDLPKITIDPQLRFQTVEGFGFSLTGGSALLLSRLPQTTRQALLQELFSLDGIGISFLRLSIGASDLSERSFTYNDLTAGESDFELAHFDLQAGDQELVPLLQEILTINPAIHIIATPWSAPCWMKTNQSWVGGSLKSECQAVYAQYFVNYLLAMREQGIFIHAITPQNEPHNHKNDPSMVMSAEAQANFVKNHLGPALADHGLGEVEIFCWDHNCDVTDFTLTLFNDAEVKDFLSGSAWHLYGGNIAVLSEIHQTHPDMKLYFTEQWVGNDGQFGGDLMWHIRNVLIGATRNWCNIVLEWNLASDPNCCPHTAGGEARCVGALTVDGEKIIRNVAYYIIAHAAKWVRPGSLRIHSNDEVLPNVAFLTPNDELVLLVLNDGMESKTVCIDYLSQSATVTLPAGSVASYVWTASLTS